jgi:hypothetical protein
MLVFAARQSQMTAGNELEKEFEKQAKKHQLDGHAA